MRGAMVGDNLEEPCLRDRVIGAVGHIAVRAAEMDLIWSSVAAATLPVREIETL